MSTEEVFREEFEALKQELIDKHIELGMQASGRWIKGLQIVVSENTAKLEGESYTEQLAFGRAPGRFPPLDEIEAWIRAKPVIPQGPAISVSSLAFLIARSIAEAGTQYYQQGGTDLIDSVITPERMQRIIDRVGAAYADRTRIEFVRALQTAA